jgi:hypothetical protein
LNPFHAVAIFDSISNKSEGLGCFPGKRALEGLAGHRLRLAPQRPNPQVSIEPGAAPKQARVDTKKAANNRERKLLCQEHPTAFIFHRMNSILAAWMLIANKPLHETSFHLSYINIY